MTWSRVIFCSRAVIPGPSAESLHVVQCCNGLAANGVDVTLVKPVKFWRPATWRHDLAGFYGLPVRFHVRRLLELPRCSLLFDSRIVGAAARSGALLYTRYLRLVREALRRRMPFVAEIHGEEDARELNLALRGIDAGLCRGIVVITEGVKQYLCRHDRRFERYLLVAPDAVDPARFDGLLSPSEPLSVGYVGSLYPGKGMEIIAPLASEIPEVEIHVYGGSPAHVASWKQRCAGARNLHFHGYVRPSEIRHCFGRFHVGLLPNQPRVVMAHGSDIGEYTSPMKLFEYMAAGRVVVASDLPVLREIIRHDENGVLVAHDDPRAWAAAIRRLSKDRALGERLAAKARDEAAHLYSYATRFERILTHIEKTTRELAGHGLQ
jgi:glycosyltransferase involved in cell wall biosynthesis